MFKIENARTSHRAFQGPSGPKSRKKKEKSPIPPSGLRVAKKSEKSQQRVKNESKRPSFDSFLILSLGDEGRFRKRAVLANVPSFRFSFRGNIRRNHPFGNHPLSTPKRVTGR